ncbi:uncharacterized protein [Pseudochaenichthys georgianus]|uniref:uncharacterized protein n=1 Tax=Pseudochaenichthys georgianus TaxID=52239 RepID=UPI0039C47E89
MALSPPSGAISCSTYLMFGYFPSSFTGTDTCITCSIVARLEVGIIDIEARFRILESNSASVKPMLVSADRPKVAPLSRPPATPEQPGDWVTVQKRHYAKPTGPHQPVHVSNTFSPLSETPAEKPALVIGSSIMRYVNLETKASTVKSIPGARAGDVEAHLKLLAKNKRKYSRIVIHVGGNDVRLRQSECTKLNVDSVCSYAKTMSDTVIFSGPLPNLINDDMYSRMSSFQRWLSWWCPANDVDFVKNWTAFWGKPGLIKRDDIHPTLEGAHLISANISGLCGLNP